MAMMIHRPLGPFGAAAGRRLGGASPPVRAVERPTIPSTAAPPMN